VARCDRRLLLGLGATTLALAAAVVFGVHNDLLLALPCLLFVLPLVAGRYLGEERLARLAAAFVSADRRRPPAVATKARRSPRALPRGGTLIAASLAVRPPPAALRAA
jgi:uncharacterized iron-regulated membrane protein